MSRNRSFLELCRCFRNDPPKAPDWLELIGLANQTLTTPHLIEIVRQRPDAVPADLAHCVETIFERNSQRNDRLLAQLGEALAALNARGITPVLLKGAAMLAESNRDRRGRRMACDLDLLVRPDEVEEALDCLIPIGYRVHDRSPPDVGKWWLDLGRANDVGMIDLHVSPPGPAFCHGALADLGSHCQRIKVGSGAAQIPSRACQAFILIMHDQFQDHDYWIGATDLRHLLDLRDLASTAGFDWKELASFTVGKLARNALETELTALHELLGVEVPLNMRRRIAPRLQQQRRMLQLRFPRLAPLLLATGLVDLLHYRVEAGSQRTQMEAHTLPRLFPRVDTIRSLLALLREKRASKI
ncbi:hypothetical protein CCR94_18075 [Rhodoblastus sphagnicola]|uniref:Nucleotidyltransferase family protein n=2 Tax=Rhodoblastus sphagnicola TaxID=333368 RepID=A0A2S6N176_9HYPH|nr:hypothetical protein CCR94_18075 [Rhodoblastus sphagnicola]